MVCVSINGTCTGCWSNFDGKEVIHADNQTLIGMAALSFLQSGGKESVKI